jgi:hypothetical protein
LSAFWSNRRAGVAAEAEAEKQAVEAQVLAEEQASFDGMEEAEVLAALDLPDPDTLTKGDDFSVFMARAVPDYIRRRALRTLWRSNPVLANLDNLIDYGEDYTDAAMAVENIQTSYQVGKGMLKHIEEMARQAEARANPPVVEEIEEQPEEDVRIATEERAEPLHSDEVAEVKTEEPYAAPSARRMTFRVEETA